MPSFCRHNRFVENCPICREPDPAKASTRAPRQASSGARRAGGGRGGGAGGSRAGRGTDLRIRREERAGGEPHETGLAPGLRVRGEVERLAEELAFAAGRLAELATEPPGLYAEVATAGDPDDAAWLAFLIAYLSPLEGDDPWAGIRAARTRWGEELPSLAGVPLGPRTAHDPARGDTTLAAYRAWASRSGGQAAALAGEAAWTPERRFDRVFERLALPGLGRSARFEFLVLLGRLGVADVRAGSLRLAQSDEVTIAAKRALGIGDPLLLERRSAELAEACDVPLEAIDLALFNWARPPGERAHLGASDTAAAWERTAIESALGL